MSALICGSFAFDTISVFEGRFSDQILPDQLHILNVSFFVPTMRRDFGGCAGNIAYSLKLLGGEAVPVATVGDDGAAYLERLQKLGISTQYMRQISGEFTAQAMIMTDRDNNQITSFHPGAMMHAHTIEIPKAIQATENARIAIISPDSPQAMQTHADQLVAAGIPFVFDPGQNLPLFDGKQLKKFVDQATWIAVNDYEAKLLCDRTDWDLANLSKQVKALIVTRAELGCDIWIQGEKTNVPAIAVEKVGDPTGCGDAWRGALLFGLERGWDLLRCAELGNRVAARKIAQKGPQNYDLDFAVA